jgi:hypothetical protein
VHLTPRFALQQLGTEWGRRCYDNVWVDYILRVHKELQLGGCYYDEKFGLRGWMTLENAKPKTDVVAADVRFLNEISAIQKAGGAVIRVIRPGPMPARIDKHPSEQEALQIHDSRFDYVIDNDCDLAELKRRSLLAYSVVTGGRVVA